MNQVIYNLSKLNNNTKNISYKNNDAVFVCIFQIIQNSSINTVYKPYLSYLFYKYPENKKNEDLIFPFKVIKNNKHPFTISNSLVNKLIDGNTIFKGFLTNNNSHFFFYQLEKQYNPILLAKRDQQLWWAIIDEICNKKKLLNFNFSPITYELFYNNPYLIYIRDFNNNKIEIPVVSFYCGPAEIIPYAAAVGIRANASTTYGSFYYTKSFNGCMRNSLYTSNYRERNIFRKIISDKNGKYFQGAVIRFAAFLTNNRHILYRKSDPFYYFIEQYDNYQSELSNENLKNKTKELKGKWAQKYDSLTISKIKLNNLTGYFNNEPTYIIKSQKQLISLSYHLLDMKFTPPTWNPHYTDYKIK